MFTAAVLTHQMKRIFHLCTQITLKKSFLKSVMTIILSVKFWQGKLSKVCNSLCINIIGYPI